MDVVIRLGVHIEMHWALFLIGTLQLNTSLFCNDINRVATVTYWNIYVD